MSLFSLLQTHLGPSQPGRQFLAGQRGRRGTHDQDRRRDRHRCIQTGAQAGEASTCLRFQFPHSPGTALALVRVHGHQVLEPQAQCFGIHSQGESRPGPTELVKESGYLGIIRQTQGRHPEAIGE